MNSATIAAIATPPGYGGIGIVKISGPDAIRAGMAIFRRPQRRPELSERNWTPESRRLYYGHVIDPEENRRIDEVMFVVMRGPVSYTGEDVVEIQAHAGPLVLKSILNLLFKRGVRLAGPGEFTRRAFLNGRIDLTQTEAVIDLINARSASAIDLAMQQLDGRVQSEIQTIRNELLDILAELEAGIDFPDDVEGSAGTANLVHRLENSVISPIQKLIQGHEDRNWLREGLQVVIAGSPNVGKSSLLNQLVNRDRAIVTEHPGTTRDLVEDGFVINGVPVIITDTAGIHDYPDPIERVGIDKALAHIDSADLILFVLDISQPLESAHFNFMEQFQHKPVILVLNKMDLPGQIAIPEKWQDFPVIRISAKFNQAIDRLKALVAEQAFNDEYSGVDFVVPNLRQKQALEKCLASVEAARNGLLENQSAEFIVIDLNEAVNASRKITGESLEADILDRIFERFCVGK